MRPWLILLVLFASVAAFVFFTDDTKPTTAASVASLDEDGGPIQSHAPSGGSSIQVEAPQTVARDLVSELAQVKPAITITGPLQARVGDMPQFVAVVEGFNPKLIQWTVDPPVTRRGEDTDRLSIATPVTGQYRVSVFAVDAQFRRIESTSAIAVSSTGIAQTLPQTEAQLSSQWTDDVPAEALESAIELRSILRDMASLLRQDEITSYEQFEASFDAALRERLGLPTIQAYQPWFLEFNRYLEKIKRRGKLNVLKDFAPVLDGVADGLPVTSAA